MSQSHKTVEEKRVRSVPYASALEHKVIVDHMLSMVIFETAWP